MTTDAPGTDEATTAPIVLLLSGPNLNLLGEREPEVYGTATLDDIVAETARRAGEHGLHLEHHQSNHEGDLVELIHAARGRCAAIVINPGALTHYGWSLHDALAAFSGPVVEVHLSSPAAREPWRHTSVVSPVATGTISGFGALGYRLAVTAVADRLGDSLADVPHDTTNASSEGTPS
jgi:3-dehydroquinate dehydratase II